MARKKHKVAEVSELSEDGDRIIEVVEGTEVAVFLINGEYHAIANYCPHIAGPLCEGKLMGSIKGSKDGSGFDYNEEEKIIVCPWHGWQFDITTGTNNQTSRYAVPTYDVEIENGEIYVMR